MNRIKKITLFLLVFTLVFASAFFLVACNEQQEDEGDITRDLYVYAIAFEDAGATEEESSAKVQADADSSADKTAIVYLTFSKTDRKIEGANALWHSEKRKDGEFYFVTTIKISLSPESIFSAVKESIPQEDLVKDEVEYNRLKVVLRYDTIYKSIKSNGEITRSGRIYTHAFALDENLQNDVFTLEMRSANSANWYAVLAACAFGGVLISIIATLAVKGAKWQKTKTKE